MGKRGPKKGAIYKPTIQKAEARELTRSIITASLAPMLRAQIANAQGIGHLFTRDKNMKFTRIEDQDEALRVLNEGTQGKDFWIFMKDPSTQAFSELLDRALDQAMKPLEVSGAGGGPLLVKWQD